MQNRRIDFGKTLVIKKSRFGFRQEPGSNNNIRRFNERVEILHFLVRGKIQADAFFTSIIESIIRIRA